MNDRIVRRRFPIAGGLLGLLTLALLGYAALNVTRPADLEVLGAAPSFVLTDQFERPVSSDDLRGKVVVADFIYTHCPDVCPLLSQRMQALQARLRGEGLLGRPVQLLSFTVDPARDTPPVLRAYAERYQADPEAWRFLTGPEEVVVPLIVRGFYLSVQALPSPTTRAGAPDSGTPDEVMHSDRFVLVDGEGRIRAYYTGSDLDPEQVLRDIRHLLR